MSPAKYTVKDTPATTTTVGTGIIHLRPYATNTAVGHENVAREIQSLFSRE
jgi:hypothetical protein